MYHFLTCLWNLKIYSYFWHFKYWLSYWMRFSEIRWRLSLWLRKSSKKDASLVFSYLITERETEQPEHMLITIKRFCMKWLLALDFDNRIMSLRNHTMSRNSGIKEKCLFYGIAPDLIHFDGSYRSTECNSKATLSLLCSISLLNITQNSISLSSWLEFSASLFPNQ